MPNEDPKNLPTPATTPGSIDDEERCLVPQYVPVPTPKKSWSSNYPPPYAILTASVFEVLLSLSAFYNIIM